MTTKGLLRQLEVELLFCLRWFLGCVVKRLDNGFLGSSKLTILLSAVLLLLLAMTISLLQLIINVIAIIRPLMYIQRIISTLHHLLLSTLITVTYISPIITNILTLLYILKWRLIHSPCYTLPYMLSLTIFCIPLYCIAITGVYYLRLCHPRAMILYRLRHGVRIMIQVVRCELEL